MMCSTTTPVLACVWVLRYGGSKACIPETHLDSWTLKITVAYVSGGRCVLVHDPGLSMLSQNVHFKLSGTYEMDNQTVRR